MGDFWYLLSESERTRSTDAVGENFARTRSQPYSLPRKRPTDDTACCWPSRVIVGIATMSAAMLVLSAGGDRRKPIKVDSVMPGEISLRFDLVLIIAFLQYFLSSGMASSAGVWTHSLVDADVFSRHGSPNAVFPPVQYSFRPRIQADSPRPFLFPRRGAASFAWPPSPSRRCVG